MLACGRRLTHSREPTKWCECGVFAAALLANAVTTGRKASRWLVVGLLAFSCTHSAGGEEPSDRDAVIDAFQRDAAGSTRVEASVEATRALQEIERFESALKWGEAAEAYDRLIGAHGRELVRLDARLFVNVTDHVNDRLRRWPAEARQEYGRRFEASAARDMRRAGDAASTDRLLAIADRWWLTYAGGRAADQVAQRYLENGRFGTAARMFDHLWRYHPAGQYRADVAVRAALAWAWAGRVEEASEAVARARAIGGGVRWFGASAGIDALVNQLRALSTSGAGNSGGDSSWPMSGGDATRNRRAGSVPRPGEPFWRFRWSDLVPHGLQGDTVSRRGSAGSFDEVQSRTGAVAGALVTQGQAAGEPRCLPVVEYQRVYVQDATRVVAIHLNSGLVDWSFENTNGTSEPREKRVGGMRGFLSPVVSRGLLVAVLAGDPIPISDTLGAEISSTLVCLDASTGELQWRAAVAERGGDGSSQAGMYFDGSPLIHEQSVYVVVRREREFGFKDCALARFDLASGRRIWQIHLASAPTSSGKGGLVTRCDPAAVGDAVFVQTNLGAVVAVSAESGLIRWIAMDDDAETGKGGDSANADSAKRRSAWTLPAAMLVTADRCGFATTGDPLPHWLLIVPNAARDLLIYDAADGRFLRRFSSSHSADPLTFVGPVGNLVLAVGRQILAFDLTSGQVRWQASLPAEDCVLAGRPFVTVDQLFVPTRQALHCFSLDGVSRGTYAWPSPRAAGHAGNLVAVDGLVLSAGEDGVSCDIAAGGALARLETRVSRGVDGGQADLDYASFALVRSSLRKRGLDALDVVLKDACLGTRGPITLRPSDDGRLRAQAFAVVLSAADAICAGESSLEKSQAAASSVSSLDASSAESLITELQSRALLAARGCEEQVRWRVVFAHALRCVGRNADSLRLYQQVLDNRQLREQRILDGQRLVRAESIADREIGRLIEHCGRGVYASVGAVAAEMQREAIGLSSPTLLEEVIHRFPNAESTPAAVMALAEQRRKLGCPQLAAELLEDSLLRYGSQRRVASVSPPHDQGFTIDAPDFIRRIVDCRIEASDLYDAATWLDRGARDFPQARFEVDGRKITFADLHRLLLDARPSTHSCLPLIAPPLQSSHRMTFSEPVAVVSPVGGSTNRHGCQPADLLIHHGGLLQAIDPFADKPIWTIPLVGDNPPAWIGSWGPLAILTTRFQVFAIDTRDGRVAWSFGRRPRDADSPAIDPEFLPGAVADSLDSTRVVRVLDDGRAYALRLRDGEEIWRRVLRHPVKGPLAMNDEYLVYPSDTGVQEMLIVLDMATGRELRTIELGADRRVAGLEISSASSIIATGPDWLAWFSPATGECLRTIGPDLHYQLASVAVGTSCLCLSTGDGGAAAYGLRDGGGLWSIRDARLPRGGIIDAWLESGGYYVATGAGSYALDAMTGQTRWVADSPTSFHPQTAWLTQAHVILAGTVQAENGGQRGAIGSGPSAGVLFIDRTSSGVAGAAKSVRQDLGVQPPASQFVALRDALVAWDGGGLTCFHGQESRRSSASSPRR